MISRSVINKLESYNNSPFPILSVYLGADTTQAPTRELLMTLFHSLLHENLTKNERAQFKDDIERIETFIQNYVPTSRSVVFFSAGDVLWETARFEFDLPHSVTINTSPHLSPILQALKKYTEYLVILVDREKARVFTVEQGEITNHRDFRGSYVPHKVQATGRDEGISDTDANARHNDVLLQRHIEVIIKKITSFIKSHSIHFVIIGGHAGMFKKVSKSLPADLQAKLVGHFVTEIDIPLSELLHESKKIAASVTK